MSMNLLVQRLLDFSAKAVSIARKIREDKVLFSLLVEEKTGDGKNQRFSQDFKTLADVLIQQTLCDMISKKVSHTFVLIILCLPSHCFIASKLAIFNIYIYINIVIDEALLFLILCFSIIELLFTFYTIILLCLNCSFYTVNMNNFPVFMYLNLPPNLFSYHL